MKVALTITDDAMKSPQKNTAILVIFLIVALGLSWLFWSVNDKTNGLTLWGNIDIRQVDVGFRVFGKLRAVHFEEGDVVVAGDLLAELDDTPYIETLRESAARLASIKENLALATAQLGRRSALVSGKSVSEEDFEQAYYQQKILESNLLEAGAALENSKIRLADTKLYAPSPGVIYTRIREPGTVLNISEPVYSVAIDAPLWARTYISEPDLGRIFPGMVAEITTDTPENPIYRGHIGFISPIAEFSPKNVETPDLRTSLVYQLRVVIDNPDKGLRQGMPVTIKLTTE